MPPLIPLALQIVGLLTGASGVASSGIGNSLIRMLAGDKAESVADKVIAAAKQVFGTDDPKQIELAIQQDKSKAELALKQMDKDLEEYRLQIDDTKNVRARDIDVRRISGGTNARANVMLIGAFVCLCGVLAGTMVYRASIPDGVLAILNTACGSLLTLLGQAFNFEFGSSRSSSEKTGQMAAMLARK